MDFHLDSIPLFDGSYDINVGISGPGGILYDWREPACNFEMMNPGRSTGVVSIAVRPVLVPREGVDASPSAQLEAQA